MRINCESRLPNHLTLAKIKNIQDANCMYAQRNSLMAPAEVDADTLVQEVFVPPTPKAGSKNLTKQPQRITDLKRVTSSSL